VNVAVVGCGLIGSRRATVAATHPGTRLALVADTRESAARELAATASCDWSTDWREALRMDIDVVVVATPNGLLAPIGMAALGAGKHVLIEKPMGRNLDEAIALAHAAAAARRLLKVGFNHRYHPALARAYERFRSGDLGTLINVRARYGHGGRPGYEAEWRGDIELAGGGELTDQGVHVLDLVRWFAGDPTSVYCARQTAVWPIAPLEENAFSVLRYPSGAVATFHTSWTQWKNVFSFEVFGTAGALAVEGLGKSYGIERLVETRRNMAGGVPETTEVLFDGPDDSWRLEWAQFVDAIERGTAYHGDPPDGLAVMRVLDALYRSSEADAPINLS
jgi:predicted dehydrogenase